MSEENKTGSQSTSNESKKPEDIFYNDDKKVDEGNQETPEEKTARETADASAKELSDRAEKVGLKPDATEDEIKEAENKKVEKPDDKKKEEKNFSITELQDAAQSAIEKWQADPTPENKKLADKAVDDSKKAVEDQNKADVKYDVKLPENSLLPKERAEEIVTFARERGFSNEVAQALVERENLAVSNYAESAMSQLEEMTNVTWVNQITEDKEVGGDNFVENAELSKRVLKKFGTEDFIKVLNPRSKENPDGTGYGNHPELFRFFVRVGKSMKDDSFFVSKNKGTEKKSAAEIFYGSSEKK